MKTMKSVILFIVLMFIATLVYSQVPMKMSYQAVVRDTASNLVTNQEISMKVSILQGTTEGVVVYVEDLNPITNLNGLISIEIGAADGFSSINWANGPYFLKTEIDPSGGTDFSILGISQLLSVPYSMYSNKAKHQDNSLLYTF